MYLPLAELRDHGPAVLEGLDEFPLLVLDDVDAVAGRDDWEERLFHLYNRFQQNGQSLLFAASQPPRSVEWVLQDWQSRLCHSWIFQLHELNDADKKWALQSRAGTRGFDISDEVAGFILNRCKRDMHSLFQVLDRLDDASLQRQRRLTIPFVKEIMAW